MRSLIYLPSTLKIKKQCLETSPEKIEYFNELEKYIINSPETGIPSSCLSKTGKSIPCFQKTVKLLLFSNRISYEKSQLTAQYVYNDEKILIFNLYFSV